ncbi:MAG TPA: asparagine synthase (glutamine-hydrolyzing) [Povalibacter sp.]|uniref:asparagine synthase (glutamine-hydrolyzing) n=1 Tax=Povalibacter sp. TaxID=1962978 RepID=UPI002D1A86DA|nr:asparagine synthase (glutamine-hydrolyzing) [Povalibacter sp.]HMN43718.1 asparagine synthase (glutamine-hydrolyzing) [Povalibacter sp.]
MCGIAGFLSASASLHAHRTLDAMTDALEHRGPDDRGIWHDADSGIGLGHRRLSIIDLSADGHQPMFSASQRYAIVFNGEIYNYRELSAELSRAGRRFKGHSDTEVLLAAVETWGLEEALRRSNGMLAIALWDRQERRLHLARDRIGKKPLYYGWLGNTIVFGSELKPFFAHPAFELRIDRDSLALFLRHGYVPGPWSILQNIYKLPPGSSLTLTSADAASGGRDHSPHEACRPYWDSRQVLGAAVSDPLRTDTAATIDTLDTLLRDAVSMRMHADVPLGAFLSGGVDSSLIVAMMQAQSSRPVQTFSIGFNDSKNNEAPEARAIATHLGTDHTELYVTGESALDLVPDLPRLFDEPFADSSQIPTCLVSRLARQSVKVSLSGDGGDELFAGYMRYQRALRVARLVHGIPGPVRSSLAWALRSHANREARVSKLAMVAAELGTKSAADIYRNRMSKWRNPGSVALHSHEHATPFTHADWQLPGRDMAHGLMYLDLVTYLPEDILAKVDRASMAVGLEARAPLLDYRVVELAFRIPTSLKLRDGQQKWILRQLLRRYLPETLIKRPKTGFAAPVSAWLSGALRTWAQALLDPARIAREGYLAPGPIADLWTQYLGGQRKWHTHLWNVLMFQAWLEWAQQQQALHHRSATTELSHARHPRPHLSR